MNGKPHDHPLTDIFIHRIEVYGEEADDLIRKIGTLCSRRELDQWWEKEVGWTCDRNTALDKARTQYKLLCERAKEGGWEIDPKP
jgi:hypothetical protein